MKCFFLCALILISMYTYIICLLQVCLSCNFFIGLTFISEYVPVVKFNKTCLKSLATPHGVLCKKPHSRILFCLTSI